MLDLPTLLLITLTFLLAGTVKGIVGFGLPTVALAILTATVGLPSAMVLFLVPSFATNIWQAVAGGNTAMLLSRFWPLLLAAFLSVWIGAIALTMVDEALLSALLGVIIVIYALLGLSRWQASIVPERARRLGPAVGLCNGILTGMTGSFVVPGVIFLQALGLPRDHLIQAMGMLFTTSTVALALALGGFSLLDFDQGLLSVIGVAPAVLGMIAGQGVRKRMSEALFRRVFLLALMALGGYIVARSLL